MSKNRYFKQQILEALKKSPLDTGELARLFNCKNINNLKHHLEQLSKLECIRKEKPKEVKRGMAHLIIYVKDFPSDGFELLKHATSKPKVVEPKIKPLDFGSEYLNKMLGVNKTVPKFGRVISSSPERYKPSRQEQTNIRSRQKYYVSGAFLSTAV